MKTNDHIRYRAAMLLALIIITTAGVRLRADTQTTGLCSGVSLPIPFVDVPGSNTFFCQIAGAYFSGLTNGTSATTYTPAANVPREQMAAFVSRTLDQSLKRGSPRAALGQFWTPDTLADGGVYRNIQGTWIQSDGRDLWVTGGNGELRRVRASDGVLLGSWTIPVSGVEATGRVLVARGLVYLTVLGGSNPGRLYVVDPATPPGTATLVTNSLGINPAGIAYDGNRIWTANGVADGSTAGSVSIVSFTQIGTLVSTITQGFDRPIGILYDGANIWVADAPVGGGNAALKKLDANGNVLQTVPIAGQSFTLTFDGTNIWVPCFDSNELTVVRAATGQVIATLTANGLNNPIGAAFDGERILVTNTGDNAEGVSLWKATGLTPLGFFPTGNLPGTSGPKDPSGVCSDGRHFYVKLRLNHQVIRF